MKLKLEMSELYYQPDKSTVGNTNIMITPPLGDDNWVYRVMVSEKQAIVGFKKFMTMGIGFMIESYDWNRNLPWSHDTMDLWEHIKENKGDDSISDTECVKAIEMIQDVVKENKDDLGVL